MNYVMGLNREGKKGEQRGIDCTVTKVGVSI
jgi:hypothetical protein